MAAKPKPQVWETHNEAELDRSSGAAERVRYVEH